MKVIFRTYTEKQANEKRKEQQTKYNMPFSCYHIGQGFCIRPAVTLKSAKVDQEAAEQIKPFVPKGMGGLTFDKIAEAANMNVKNVANGAWTLVKNEPYKYTPCIGRDGYFVAIREK